MPGGALRLFSRPARRAAPSSPAEAGFRRMRVGDLDSVHRLELLSYSFPWTKGAFRDCLRSGYETWLLVREQELLGYGVLFTGAGESHLLNLCVHPDHRGQDLGRRLLMQLLERASRQQSQVLYLEVRPSNRAALRLYRQEGFLQIGRRGNYYPAREGREDALVFARRLDGA